jgi:hypothetical protein
MTTETMLNVFYIRVPLHPPGVGKTKTEIKLRVLSPRANYTDRVDPFLDPLLIINTDH